MPETFAQRSIYRVKQFGWAIAAWRREPDERELAQARRALPSAGWPLFRSMPRADQTHALKVWAAVRNEGFEQPALAQAALLHDVAKHLGGVMLAHRVAVVLIKAFAPSAWERLQSRSAPSRQNPLYPLWAHANHPAGSAAMAASAHCLPEAVELIRRHQEPLPAQLATEQDRLLAALQRADDDN